MTDPVNARTSDDQPRRAPHEQESAHVAAHPYLSIASGVGGLDLGVDRGSGGAAQPVCYVENEISAAGILVARMADGALAEAPVWSDLRTFDARPWRGKLAGIVGGYPCQPFSSLGLQRGFDDPRNLWPDIARIIDECRPQWCFFENVEEHLWQGYLNAGRPDLERLGFRCSEQLLAAEDVGAPHIRRRLFVLARAHPDGGDRPRPIAGLRAGQVVSGAWMEPESARVADDARAGVESVNRRVADGSARGLDLPQSEQLRLLGNAVVPDQAALAWRILWQAVS